MPNLVATTAETLAEKIYNTWASDLEFRPWSPGGNSNKQNDARALARRVVGEVEELERTVEEMKLNRLGVMVSELRVGPVRLAAERLRDITTGDLGAVMFNMTYDNDVAASMGWEQAKLFARFVLQVVESEEPGVSDDKVEGLRADNRELSEQIRKMRAENEKLFDYSRSLTVEKESMRSSLSKLEDFKTFVHGRLDQANVPVNPGGQHSNKGCRIGDRLDLVLDQYMPILD